MKIIVVTLFFVTVTTAQFPSFIKLCKRDSKLNECIKNNINSATGQLKNGIPSLFVSKSDPLVIEPEFTVATPTLKFIHHKGCSYSGLDKFHVQKVNLDLEKNILNIDWIWDSLLGQGPYSFKGNLLNFDINGGGECKVRTDNLGISLTMTGEREEKNGKKYIIFKKNEVKLELSKLKASIYFGGLLPTAEQTESVNKFMNENQQVAISQFQPIIAETVVAVATKSIQKLFETYSIDELFPL